MSSAAAKVALVASTGAVLSVVWWHPHFPTGDGPSHLYNAEIIRQAFSGAGRQLDYFEVRFRAFPNWTGHATLAALLGVVSPPAAEKILASVYFAGFALALGVSLGAARAWAPAVAMLGMASSINLPVMLGFYNFSLGLVAYLLTLGLWRRGLGRSNVGAAWIGLLLVIGYFSHPVTFGLALVAMVWMWLADPLRRNQDLLHLAAAAAPALLLASWYVIYGIGGHAGAIAPSTANAIGPWTKRLRDFDCLWYGDRSQHHVAWMCTGVWLVLFASSLARRPAAQRDERRAILWFSLAILAVALVVPEKVGGHGGYLVPRLVLIGLVTALGGFHLSATPWVGRFASAASAICLIASLASLGRYEVLANQDIRTYLTGLAGFGRNRVFIPIVERRSMFRVDPLAHTSSYYAIAGDNVDLGNYEADLYYFAVQFRADAPRPADVPTLQTKFATLDLERTARLTDALVIWGTVPPSVQAGSAFRPSFAHGALSIYVSNRRPIERWP